MFFLAFEVERMWIVSVDNVLAFVSHLELKWAAAVKLIMWILFSGMWTIFFVTSTLFLKY